MATGGSVQDITLDGRTFTLAADADVNIKSGGFENDASPNGDQTSRLLKTRVSWEISEAALVIDDLAGDLEFLQALADRNTFFPITVTKASGAIRQGSGQLTGEIKESSATATAPLTIMGTGVLTLQ